MAGFNTIYVKALIPQQAVAVILLDAVVSELFFTVDFVHFRRLFYQRARQRCHVTWRGVVIRVVQAMGVNKITGIHSQVGGMGIHHAGERTFRTGNVFGHGHTGVVTRLHNNTA